MLEKLVLALVVLPMVIGLTACTDDQVAVGAGVVGGAIIGGAIVSAADRHPHHGQSCNTERWCDGWGRCEYRQRCNHWSAEIGSNEAHALSDKYSLSVVGSQKVVDAVAQAKLGKLDGFREAGFSDSDMASIANGHMPSEASIQAASQVLMSKPEAVRALVKDTAREFRFQTEQAWMNRASGNY